MDTVQTAIYRMRVEGEQQIQSATRALDGMAVAEEKVTRATRATEGGFDRLMGRLDPMIRLEQQRQRALEQVARYEETGIGTSMQRARAIEMINQRYEQQTRALKATGDATEVAGRRNGALGGSLTQLSFQINDIASGLMMGQSPFTIMTQQGGQVFQVWQMNNRVFMDLKDLILGFLTPGRLLVAGFAAAGTAAYGLYRIVNTDGKTTKDLLEQHSTLIDRVKDGYKGAAEEARRFAAESAKSTAVQLKQNNLQLSDRLQQGASQFASGLGRRTFGGLTDTGALQDLGALEVDTKFKAFAAAIERFNNSIAAGRPEVSKFSEEVGAIGDANPSLQALAGTLIDTTDKLREQEDAVRKNEAAMRLLAGSATEADRQLLGLGNSLTELVKRTRERVLELQLEARSAGLTTDAVMRLKVAHELETAAKQSNIPVTAAMRAEWAKLAEEAGKAALAAERARNIASAQQELVGLQQRYQLIRATSEEERARIEAAHTYSRILKETNDHYLAARVSAQQLSNAQEEITRSAEEYERSAERASRHTRGLADGLREASRAASELTQDFYSINGQLVNMLDSFKTVGQFTVGNNGNVGSSSGSTYTSTLGGLFANSSSLFSSGGGMWPAQWLTNTLPKSDELKNSLDGLRSSTDSLNETMRNILSPYYSQDPRDLKLGFRTFADGGVMTKDGPLPLRKYADGGVAYGPQIAMYGEGSEPEAYVPLKGGAIPVKLQMPANSNSPAPAQPIIVNNHFHGAVDRDTADMVKRTGYQTAQQIRRAIGGA